MATMAGARERILAAASRSVTYGSRIYGPRQLQQAVHKCVQRGLVSPGVLRDAGFDGAARRLETRERARQGRRQPA